MAGHSRRLRRRRQPRDERGGAISLWVVLMVPVSAFAAVAAMAGPQRLAAESSVQEAADDLAAFAVAWRDGQRLPRGQLNSFPSDCASRTDQQHGAIATLNNNIPALSPPPAQGPNDPDFRNFSDLFDQYEMGFEDLLRQFKQPPPPPLRPVHSPPVPPVPPDLNAPNYQALLVAYRASLVAYQASFDTYEAENVVRVAALDSRLIDLSRRLDGWDETCGVLLEALAGDLGNLGVDFGDLRGSYSDSLETSALTGTCTIPLHTTKYACEASPGAWIPDIQFAVPCRTAEGTVVFDGVHVAISADWLYAGWAAAQVWPDGIPMAAESTGRLTQRDSVSTYLDCRNQLVVFDSQGRPIWSGSNPAPDSRQLVQSVRRSTLSG